MVKNYSRLLLLILFTLVLSETSSAQSIVSISPDSALQGQTINVVITGNSTSFGQGTSTTQVWLSQGSSIIQADSVTVISPSQMLANITIPISYPAGLYNVNTYNSVDSILVKSNAFKVKSITTGIEESPEALISGKVYPNPFSNELKLAYTLSKACAVQITMYDLFGRIISENSVEQSAAGEYIYEFDVSSLELPAGAYFVRLNTGDKNYNYKIIRN